MSRTDDARAALIRQTAVLGRRDAAAWITSVAVFSGSLLVLGAQRPLVAAGLGVGAGIGGAVAWYRRQRTHPLTASAVADTLDATVPAVQSSTALLLREPSALSMLQHLQAARVAAAVTEAAPAVRLPAARLAAPGAMAAAALVTVVAALVLPVRAATPAADSPRVSDAPAAAVPPRVIGVSVQISPPGYTGRPSRVTSDLDLEVEAGASVRWTVRTTGAISEPRLATSDRDTLVLARAADGNYTAQLMADHPLLYDFGGSAAAGVPQGVRRLAVIPDRAPVVTIVRPEERTTIESGEPLTVPVEVLGKDDYGLAGAQIVATVTTGSGENVKFREQRVAFTSQASRGAGAMIWRTTLDLDALGVLPGDELYFHVLAKDRRTPVPNEGRSETVFIRRADTTRALLAEFSGLALKVVPDYFRSQRQIIIDTEKLLAEQKGLPLDRFRERANEIGIDQHLLRVRYGELVGDENESGLGAAAAEQLESIGIETGESHAHEAMPQAEQLGPKVAELPEDAVHRHDDSENATRLASSVKATLQDALREMWSAERYLRTYDPRTALPFEYRALEFLKQVQQAARVYVKRVGFEPPPLDPEKKRLTGKLDAIRDVNRQVAQLPRDKYPGVRALLADWPAVAVPTAAQRARIHLAGEELAREALVRPGAHLDALRDLRRWLDAGAACPTCAATAQAGLYAAVPAPEPAGPARTPATAARRAFLDRLRDAP